MKQDQTVKDNRITVIDALRGFALLGVVLVHMQQHYSIFNFGAFTPNLLSLFWTSGSAG